MATRQSGRDRRGPDKERASRAAFFLQYLQYLEKTGATLIVQAKRLELLPTASICSVTGGAAAMAVVSLYISQLNLGQLPQIGAGAALTVFGLCAGHIVGRLLPGKAVRVRQEDLRRLNQEQTAGWEHIDRVTAELDALPKRKENSARRGELERRLELLRDRDTALTAQLQMEDSSSTGLVSHIGRVYVRPQGPNLGELDEQWLAEVDAAGKRDLAAPLREGKGTY